MPTLVCLVLCVYRKEDRTVDNQKYLSARTKPHRIPFLYIEGTVVGKSGLMLDLISRPRDGDITDKVVVLCAGVNKNGEVYCGVLRRAFKAS